MPKELPEDVALPKVDIGMTDVWVKVALADKFADELDMCMVVVALASTRVLVIVAVEIWVEVVVVSVLASTEAGAHRAASATAMNVRRICRDCGISLRSSLRNALDYMAKWVESVSRVRTLIRSSVWSWRLSSRCLRVRDLAGLFRKRVV